MAKEKTSEPDPFKVLVGELKKNNPMAVPDLKTVGRIGRIALDSPLLNEMMGGSKEMGMGFGRGRVYEFFGWESSGKTTVANYIASHVQKYDKQNVVVVIDYEYAYDIDFAVNVGMDLSAEKFLLIQPSSGEESFELLEQFILTGRVGCVIYDSVASISTNGEMSDAYGKANMGATARLMSQALRKLNPYIARSNTAVIFINQIRMKIGVMFGSPETTTGGNALAFYSSWRGRFSKGEQIKDASGGVIGVKIKIKNYKSKISVPFMDGELTLMYNGGIDSTEEYVNYGVRLGLIHKSGAWYNDTLDWGIKEQGAMKMAKALKAQPDKLALLMKKINESLVDLKRKRVAMDVNDENGYGGMETIAPNGDKIEPKETPTKKTETKTATK